jgi:hypothetical protein
MTGVREEFPWEDSYGRRFRHAPFDAYDHAVSAEESIELDGRLVPAWAVDALKLAYSRGFDVHRGVARASRDVPHGEVAMSGPRDDPRGHHKMYYACVGGPGALWACEETALGAMTVALREHDERVAARARGDYRANADCAKALRELADAIENSPGVVHGWAAWAGGPIGASHALHHSVHPGTLTPERFTFLMNHMRDCYGP